MKKISKMYNTKTKYKNGTARYGTSEWVKKVVANDNLTTNDHQRFIQDLKRIGNNEMATMMQSLLKSKNKV
jgi:predicted phosphohydrolase